MSSSDSSFSSSACSSAASSVAPEAAAAPSEAAPPVGTEDNFSLPSAINSSTFLPETSANNFSTWASSTSMETDSNTFLMSSADGAVLPALTNNK